MQGTVVGLEQTPWLGLDAVLRRFHPFLSFLLALKGPLIRLKGNVVGVYIGLSLYHQIRGSPVSFSSNVQSEFVPFVGTTLTQIHPYQSGVLSTPFRPE
jgi:hypothetical protein